MPAAGEAERILFHANLDGPQLESGWQWVREDADGWRFGQSGGMEFAANPGGLCGQVFADLPGPPLLLRPLDGANACEVTLTMPPAPGGFREQAGIFWYLNDNNYAKLVIEWMQDGTANMVLAREQHGDYVVCSQCPLDEEEATEPTRLRLEMSADGSQLNGCVVGSYYTRLIGSCPASSSTWGDNGEESGSLLFGISAHGGAARGRMAHFAKFDAIAVKANRVQWADAAATVPQAMAFPPQTQPSAPPTQNGYEPPAPGAGWVMSPDLSEEARNQIAALLSHNGLPALDDQESQQE